MYLPSFKLLPSWAPQHFRPAPAPHHLCSLHLLSFLSLLFTFFASYCFFPSYGLILHFADAIGLKYSLSCINHWPILSPIRPAISQGSWFWLKLAC